MSRCLDIIILGLSITSSWGNGHATTFRGLVRGLSARGHRVLFLERDVPWYASTRDLQSLPPARVELYADLAELKRVYGEEIRRADAVIVGSYVPEGVAVSEWVCAKATGITAFYDIDTPVTLAKLCRGDTEYLSRDLVPRFQLYLSFTGGPTLERIEREFGAMAARALYCSVDPEAYYPQRREKRWHLGFLGTYSPDRQPSLNSLLLQPAGHWPAGRFAVAGSQYPPQIAWPANVERIEHLPPAQHGEFYNGQLYTLNLTRADMIAAGYSPSVRLFEAAACGVAVISDYWSGLESFFKPGREVLVARTTRELLDYLWGLGEEEARQIGAAARERVLKRHTAAHRAAELEGYLRELLGGEREPASAAWVGAVPQA